MNASANSHCMIVITAEKGEYADFYYRVVCVCRTPEEANEVIAKLDSEMDSASRELNAWKKEMPNPGGQRAPGFDEWFAAYKEKQAAIAATLTDPTVEPYEVGEVPTYKATIVPLWAASNSAMHLTGNGINAADNPGTMDVAGPPNLQAGHNGS